MSMSSLSRWQSCGAALFSAAPAPTLQKCSVADPDPDPVRSCLFWSPGAGSGWGKIADPDPVSTKRCHVIQIFSL